MDRGKEGVTSGMNERDRQKAKRGKGTVEVNIEHGLLEETKFLYINTGLSEILLHIFTD